MRKKLSAAIRFCGLLLCALFLSSDLVLAEGASSASKPFYSLNEQWNKDHTPGAKPSQEVQEALLQDTLRNGASKTETGAFEPPILDKTLSEIITQNSQELEYGQTLYIRDLGSMSKYVPTDENILELSDQSSQVLIIKGIQIGTTYVHLWNTAGRNTFQVRVIPQLVRAPLYAEEYAKLHDKTKPLTFTYDVTRGAFYTADKVRELKRDNLDLVQRFALDMGSPYGQWHTHVQTNKLLRKNIVTDGQVTLTDGHIGAFDNFNASAFDTAVKPDFIVFPSARIRGADIQHWDESKRLNWEAFYGRELSSIIGILTPGLLSERSRNSKLGGAFADFQLNDSALLQGGFFTGSGRDRLDDLNRKGAALGGSVKFGEYVTLKPEVDFDNENIAQKHLLSITGSRLKMNFQYRDIKERFQSLLGNAIYQGELGYLFSFEANPFDRLSLGGSVDIFRDRLLPNPDDLYGRNIHTDLYANYNPWDKTNIRFNYQDYDDTARVGPTRQKLFGLSVNQAVNLFNHDYGFFVRYQNRGIRLLNNPLLDYVQNQVVAGMQTRIFWDMDFSVQQEWSHLEEPNIRLITHPGATTWSLGKSQQLWELPLFYNWNLRVRDEEDTDSQNSFMSGTDSAEVSAGFTYKGIRNFEIFLNGSLENYKKEGVAGDAPRSEAQFLTGMRYVKETNWKWAQSGSFEGVVFKDLNGNGKQDPNESGLENVKVYISDSKSAMTGPNGYYLIPDVAGESTTLFMDLSSLPSGYVATTAVSVDAEIENKKTKKISFGVASKSEIRGIVFNDLNGNGSYDRDEPGLKNVKIKNSEGKIVRSNERGSYSMSDVLVGDVQVQLDVLSLAEGYLPRAATKKTIHVSEGVRYELHFPMKAQRTLTGRVYVDTNNNGFLDSADKVVPGAKVTLGSLSVVSDSEGWYLFDDISSGSYMLDVISAQDHLSPKPINVEFAKEPSAKTMDIKLAYKEN